VGAGNVGAIVLARYGCSKAPWFKFKNVFSASAKFFDEIAPAGYTHIDSADVKLVGWTGSKQTNLFEQTSSVDWPFALTLSAAQNRANGEGPESAQTPPT
jgi:hypothetical protein